MLFFTSQMELGGKVGVENQRRDLFSHSEVGEWNWSPWMESCNPTGQKNTPFHATGEIYPKWNLPVVCVYNCVYREWFCCYPDLSVCCDKSPLTLLSASLTEEETWHSCTSCWVWKLQRTTSWWLNLWWTSSKCARTYWTNTSRKWRFPFSQERSPLGQIISNF